MPHEFLLSYDLSRERLNDFGIKVIGPAMTDCHAVLLFHAAHSLKTKVVHGDECYFDAEFLPPSLNAIVLTAA